MKKMKKSNIKINIINYNINIPIIICNLYILNRVNNIHKNIIMKYK